MERPRRRPARFDTVNVDPMTKTVRRREKPRERWLLTRKTWKYMADAGRRLIPEGAQNRIEDIPRLEAYFQEVCSKEPRFLLWRKSSYPGAIPRPRKKKRARGGSVRARSPSDDVVIPRPTDLALASHTSGGRFDIAKLRRDFFASPKVPPPLAPIAKPEDEEENTLVDLLRTYLKLEDDKGPTRLSESEELVRALRKFLSRQADRTPTDSDGNHAQRTLLENLGRYYGRAPNRDNIVQDLLTDRGLLKRLYHDLRKTKPYRGGRNGGSNYGQTFGNSSGSSRVFRSRIPGRQDFGHSPPLSPPPLIEVVGESQEDKNVDVGTQTLPIPEEVLIEIERTYREKLEAETAPTSPTSPPPERKPARRRSSVDHDDVSQSVSDTIKRYLRMARKKSVDADKADRFKRINYDKNLRNIKPRAAGEVDDDGLNKGCQTVEDWILTYRDLQFASMASTPTSPPPSPGQTHSFFSNLLGRTAPAVANPPGGMQKSRSSSSVVQSVSKRLWRHRSRSSSRVSTTWTPQGSCCWADGAGRCVRLTDTSLLTLSDVERKALQLVAKDKLVQLKLGTNINIPDENAGAQSSKPKRRPYILKRKARTTSFFDQRITGDKDKDSTGTGSVFGVPLSQCVETERALRRQQHGGSRASLSSIGGIERDDNESCDSGDWGWAGLDDGVCAGPKVPGLVSACLSHLRRNGLRTLGLFRVSASKKRVRQLREDWERGQEGALDSAACPHDVASLLKEFLRDLPDPLLCRDLYLAFLLTQKIRNRRIQWEALRLVICLLPAAHRDTLHALLTFLSSLASHAQDDLQPGNKMDAANLATVFAPNILHRNKPNEAASEEQLSERADVINVVRVLIERQGELWTVPAEDLHEVYRHLATTRPDHLDALLMRKAEVANERLNPPPALEDTRRTEESRREESRRGDEGRRMWSREEFLHGGAATGGPDRDVPNRRSDKSYSRTRRAREAGSDTSSGSLSSAMTIVTRNLDPLVVVDAYHPPLEVRLELSDLVDQPLPVLPPTPPKTTPVSQPRWNFYKADFPRLVRSSVEESGVRTDSAHDSNDSNDDTEGGSESCVIRASLHIPGVAPPRPPRSTSTSDTSTKRDSAVGSSSPASLSGASSPPSSPPPTAVRVTLTARGEHRVVDPHSPREHRVPETHSTREHRIPDTHTPKEHRVPDTHTPKEHRVPDTHTPKEHRVPDTHTPREHRVPDIDTLISLGRERNTSDARAVILRQHDENTVTKHKTRHREESTSRQEQRSRDDRTLTRQDNRQEGVLYKRGELISSARSPPP